MLLTGAPRGGVQAKIDMMWSERRTGMPGRPSLAVTVVALLCATVVAAPCLDSDRNPDRYPDWKGQWIRARVPGAVGQPPHDPSKPPGRGQQAPLTAEYQARFEANLAEQAAGR